MPLAGLRTTPPVGLLKLVVGLVFTVPEDSGAISIVVDEVSVGVAVVDTFKGDAATPTVSFRICEYSERLKVLVVMLILLPTTMIALAEAEVCPPPLLVLPAFGNCVAVVTGLGAGCCVVTGDTTGVICGFTSLVTVWVCC